MYIVCTHIPSSTIATVTPCPVIFSIHTPVTFISCPSSRSFTCQDDYVLTVKSQDYHMNISE